MTIIEPKCLQTIIAYFSLFIPRSFLGVCSSGFKPLNLSPFLSRTSFCNTSPRLDGSHQLIIQCAPTISSNFILFSSFKLLSQNAYEIIHSPILKTDRLMTSHQVWYVDFWVENLYQYVGFKILSGTKVYGLRLSNNASDLLQNILQLSGTSGNDESFIGFNHR